MTSASMTTHRCIRIALAVTTLGASLAGCGLHGRPKVARKQQDAAQGSEAVRDATLPPGEATDQSAGVQIVAPGIVEPWGGQVELSAHEPGWIDRILVKEGEVVRRGQLLAVLDAEPQRHAVELARADLGQAQARAGFARAQAGRLGRLHEDGTVSDNDAERAATDALVENAEAEGAEARLRLAQAGLESRRIASPRSGTVLLSRFHPGEFYQPGAGPLFVLGDMTRLQVRLEVDEVDASELSVGAPCVLVSDGGVPLAQGKIVRLAPKMGRRRLPIESPTARADVRIREAFVEIPSTAALVPGQRVWGHTPRVNPRTRT